ncbi:MAG: DUF3395 domain-containing protein [Anaerolineae bacterium]
MNQNVKYLLIGSALAIPLSIIGNLVTPYFQNNLIGIAAVLIFSIAIPVTIAYPDIKNWSARRSLISKTQRINELQGELAAFKKLRDEVGSNTNRFLLLTLSNVVFPFIILVLALYTTIPLPSIVFSEASSVTDFLSLATAPVVLIIASVAFVKTLQGWKKLKTICYLEEYEQRIKKQIERLSVSATTPKKLTVLSAKYGVPHGTMIDVTDIITSKVNSNQLHVLVDNELAGVDPVPGVKKELHVEYSYDNRRQSIVIAEGEPLSLPQ